MNSPSGRRPNATEIARAARALRGGGIVAFPTETVYGLGAHALDAGAVARIYALKGRPTTSPLIVHVADAAQARRLAVAWPPAAERLAAAFWPGALTLIVRKSAQVPAVVTAGLDTVGLRVPAHPVARELLAAAGIPVAAPSANRFMRLSATRAAHVREAFPEGLDAVLDGGRTPLGIESTVVSLAGAVPLLLRPGAIPLDRLRGVVGHIAAAPGGKADGPHTAPGMHARHYSPRTRLIVLRAGDAPPAGRGTRVRRRDAVPVGAASGDVTLPPDAAGYAAQLYDTLHDLDARQLDWIAIDEPPPDPAWDAVRDRLRRAASV